MQLHPWHITGLGDTWVDDKVDDDEVEPDTECTEDDRCDEVGPDENESIKDDVRADEDSIRAGEDGVRADEDNTYIANYFLLKIPQKMQHSRRIVKNRNHGIFQHTTTSGLTINNIGKYL